MVCVRRNVRMGYLQTKTQTSASTAVEYHIIEVRRIIVDAIIILKAGDAAGCSNQQLQCMS
jgi:hypothetical protein